MNFTPSYYIPLDRRHAMAQSIELPERSHGAALFADISGFTPLTEALGKELGHQRGAEELTRHLNLIFEGLIDDLERYHGSVIGFSGDAITCWIDGDDGIQALACALAMQHTIQRFSTLTSPSGAVFPIGIKVSVASGEVRRFRVGDPNVQYWDVMTGETLYRLAEAEHQARRGEVLVAAEVVKAAGECLLVEEWRQGNRPGERYAVVSQLICQVDENPWPALDPASITEEQVRPWILPRTFERVKTGQGFFESELRPVVAMFLRFGGIDYDKDEAAGQKLDHFIRWVQSILTRFDGSMIQLTFGDKGSYLSAAFGAPVAHEDDVARSALAALRLLSPPPGLEYISEIQIGISKGRMLVGPYGSPTMRTYGVLGDHTNLAARLMQIASAGEVLISESAQQEAAEAFLWEECSPFRVKGKSDLLSVFRLKSVTLSRSGHLQEPRYALPMVGRKKELSLIEHKLSQVQEGQGQIVAVTAEAGLGKSRLVAGMMRRAIQQDIQVHAGECHSYGTNISYLVWRSIWQSLFNLNPEASLQEQTNTLRTQLKHVHPRLVQRLPLLGTLLNLTIPDNSFTQSLDARLRKESLESLLVDCLRTKARQAPLLLILEDCQWIDPLSNDLLEVLGRAIPDLPVMIGIAYRPPDISQAPPRVANLPHCTVIELTELSHEEARELIRIKLGNPAPAVGQSVNLHNDPPEHFITRLMERAQGNPFYIEELINYLNDRNLSLHDSAALAQLDLPESLQSLILSRIDQLRENQKILLKVASIVGRLFPLGWLWGVDPDLGEQQQVKAELEMLSNLDLTQLDQPEPEETYLFKHFVTRDVAYESLPFTTRAILHTNLGAFIERAYSGVLEQYVDLLAYHYDLSQKEAKRREYLRKAGEAAQAAYANQSAIDYYKRLLPLLPEQEQGEILLKIGQVLELVGVWPAAKEYFQKALDLSQQLNNPQTRVDSQHAFGLLLRKQGSYSEAHDWLDQAREGFEKIGDRAGVGQVLAEIGELYRIKGEYAKAQICYQESLQIAESVEETRARLSAKASVLKSAGTLANQQGNPDLARSLYEESLAIRRELGDRYGVAVLLNNLGMVAMFREDFAASQPLFSESLTIMREIGDRWAVGQLLNNLGLAERYEGDSVTAQHLLEESVEVRRALGDKWGIANSLSSLSNLLIHQGKIHGVQEMVHESLLINLELGDKTAIAYCLEDFASLAAAGNRPERALYLAGAAAALRAEIGGPLPVGEQAALDRTLEPARQQLTFHHQKLAWQKGQAMGVEEAVEYALAL